MGVCICVLGSAYKADLLCRAGCSLVLIFGWCAVNYVLGELHVVGLTSRTKETCSAKEDSTPHKLTITSRVFTTVKGNHGMIVQCCLH